MRHGPEVTGAIEETDIIRDHSLSRLQSLDSFDLLDELDPLYEQPFNETDTRHNGERYDDLSSIDWIQEYARERRRKLGLAEDQTLNGKTLRVIDQSQTWIIISLTGIAVGVLAAIIDILSLYLGDLKEGHCSPSFWKSKSFCCWGLSEDEICYNWHTWSSEMNVKSIGGSYVINYIFYCISASMLAALASYLASNYAPYASHSGIPEIKVLLSGVVIKKFLGKLTLIIKSIGLCLAVSSGLWLGKEGPLVHVACCCGSIVLKCFPAIRDNEARKREIYSAASAAGMSVAFGSPIGGVLFALEQISYYFPDRSMWQSFVCAMISSVSLQFMNPFGTGKLVLYQVVFDRDWHRFELIPFALLGLVGGLYGAYFIRLNRILREIRRDTWISHWPISEVAFLALVTSLISFPNVFTKIPASRVLTDLLQECSQGNWLDLCTKGRLVDLVLLLLSAAVLGSLLSAATFGARLPAGIILPSMTVGAALGRAAGMLVQHWHRSYPEAWFFSSCASVTDECVTPGVYAIVGAAAALSGVTRMTVSLVVIVFELTGALTYVLPIMVAVMASKFVGDAFGTQGIYDSWIEMQGYPFLDKNEDSFYGSDVRQLMTPYDELAIIYCNQRNTIASVRQFMQTFPHRGYPIVADEQSALLIGYIATNELRRAFAEAEDLSESTSVLFQSVTISSTSVDCLQLSSYVDSTPFVLATQSNIRLIANLFQKLGIRYLFLGRRGRLSGMITRKDLLKSQDPQDLRVFTADEEAGSNSSIGLQTSDTSNHKLKTMPLS